ncbi:Late embryogenesis abundant protein 1 [Aphelenchoides avenae]|nr:Late embryogenesis abundant protein 1 [Aphelenchus avenae]
MSGSNQDKGYFDAAKEKAGSAWESTKDAVSGAAQTVAEKSRDLYENANETLFTGVSDRTAEDAVKSFPEEISASL